MMTTSEKAIQMSMTHPFLSVPTPDEMRRSTLRAVPFGRVCK